jgi:ADP-ribose pyrophosphatase YjhB (NUDIX family)
VRFFAQRSRVERALGLVGGEESEAPRRQDERARVAGVATLGGRVGEIEQLQRGPEAGCIRCGTEGEKATENHGSLHGDRRDGRSSTRTSHVARSRAREEAAIQLRVAAHGVRPVGDVAHRSRQPIGPAIQPPARRACHITVTKAQIDTAELAANWRCNSPCVQIVAMKLVRVAGGIVWRETAAGARIAIVHRPRRDDWTLPKGKLDAGESWHDAARREILEETGCEVRLGRFAGAKLYLDRPEPKLVLYWHARLAREGALRSADEIDEVAWLSRREALNRLDRASDRRLLLLALGGSWRRACRAAQGSRAPDRLAPDELHRLVIVDSAKAEEALPSVLGLISSAVGCGAGRLEARRA